MSSIKLKHSGGNAVSISAPDTNPSSDRTVKLPSTDVDGVITTKDSNDNLQSVTGINGSQFANRNIIINGEMRIAQRATSVSSLSSSNEVQAVDRMFCRINGAGTWTISQSTDAPAGFGTSLKWDCTTADASPAASDFNYISQRFEGFNLQRLNKGTSDAVKTTLSFYVKSNKTGTLAVLLTDNDNSRQIGATYTINSANTWERKTITFAGDTSGAIDNNNGHSMNIIWWLVVGTDRTSGTAATSWQSSVNANAAVGHNVNLADSTSNEFYITGIQWEVGEVATNFEHRLMGQDLAECQRYYQIVRGATRNDYRSNNAARTGNNMNYFVEMRANPTATTKTAVHSQNMSSVLYERVSKRGLFFTAVGIATAGGTDGQQLCNDVQLSAEL